MNVSKSVQGTVFKQGVTNNIELQNSNYKIQTTKFKLQTTINISYDRRARSDCASL